MTLQLIFFLQLSPPGSTNTMHRSFNAASTAVTVANFAAPKSPLIPDEILRMDKKSIDLYLRILETGTETRRDIRVIVVGKQGVGKTSLIRRLLCEDVSNVQSTNGIDIYVKKCKIRIRDGKWMLEKGSCNTKQQTNARLLNSVLLHINRTSTTGITHVNNDIDLSVPTTDSFQQEVIPKEESSHQFDKHSSYDSAFRDLRDVVAAEPDLDNEDYATLTL
ncbi:uncharacterized protein LOC127730022 [Mytilus californianus]|uniref:uncharacterized protein LOC127730022 n=1 Tax=Mytilus californianus TaxID=6549 RepID=UPI002246D8A2|nr:uncharacterized protein LOC127730022 [Mytilus californianus]